MDLHKNHLCMTAYSFKHCAPIKNVAPHGAVSATMRKFVANLAGIWQLAN